MAYDIDEVPGLCSWLSKTTGEQADYHSGIGREWIEQHDWVLDEEKIKSLLRNSDKRTIFLCGIASNQKSLFPLFQKIILLTLDENTLIQRLSNRKGKDVYAREKSEQEELLSWKSDWEKEMIQHGAIAIDADKPTESIVEEIINPS